MERKDFENKIESAMYQTQFVLEIIKKMAKRKNLISIEELRKRVSSWNIDTDVDLAIKILNQQGLIQATMKDIKITDKLKKVM
jgi:hypothetical protein